jgi:hypothetical protein
MSKTCDKQQQDPGDRSMIYVEYSAPLKVSPTVIEIISDGKVEKL